MANTPASTAARRGRRAMVAVLAVLGAALVALLIVLAVDDGDVGDDGAGDRGTAPASSTPATTTTAATTTTTPSTTTPVADDTALAVWPWVESDVRYDDPVEAARAFAVDFVGFTDPVIGGFAQGDSRSGEVEVRSIATFTPTIVLVRQLGPDDSWWVIGSATANIVLEEPVALATVGSPLTVSGQSSAWEGTVDVAIRADGVAEPIFEGFVTGGAPDGLGPFEDTFEWPNPGTGAGAIVLTTASSDDGRVLEAGVVRVAFAAT